MSIEVFAPQQVAPGRWRADAVVRLGGEIVELSVTAPEALAATALARAQAMMTKRGERSYVAAVNGDPSSSVVVKMWRRVENAEPFNGAAFYDCVQRIRACWPLLGPMLTKIHISPKAVKRLVRRPMPRLDRRRLGAAIRNAKAYGAQNYPRLRDTGIAVATVGKMVQRYGKKNAYAVTTKLKSAFELVQRANAGSQKAQRYIQRCFRGVLAGDASYWTPACYIVAAVPVALEHPIHAALAPAGPVVLEDYESIFLELEQIAEALEFEPDTVGAIARIYAQSDANLTRLLRALGRHREGWRPRLRAA